MGLILASFLVVPALLGWLAERYSRASRYPHAGAMRILAWVLGVAAGLLAAWFLGRADEDLGEAFLSGGALAITVGGLWWIRAHAPTHGQHDQA